MTAIARSVLRTVQRDLSLTEAALLREVEGLAATIGGARAEIAAMGADDITASHLPAATDELDAMVEHTASATDSMLENCEQLEGLAVRMTGRDARALQASVTRVCEACSFQDIIGQRITKVITDLQAIGTKVAHVIKVFAERRRRHAPGLAGRGLPCRPAERPAAAGQRHGSIRRRCAAGKL